MSLLTVGVNHKTASIDLREQLNVPESQLPMAMQSICQAQLADEAVVFSTCNRTELYVANAKSEQALYEWMSDFHQVSYDALKSHTYTYHNAAASKHLFRVATGLDSMVIGEPQVLGQIKSAFQLSVTHNTARKLLTRLFQEAFYVAKNVRNNTKLGENSVSMVYVAAKLTEEFFSSYKDVTVLVIGAGQTGTLVAKTLMKKGVRNILIANRDVHKAQALANEVNGYAMPLAQLTAHLHEADMVFSTTGRGDYTVDLATILAGQKQRKYRMQLLIDLAVPRDIDPRIKQLENAYLFSVDDLQGIVQKNQSLRQQAAQEAEAMIEVYNDNFNNWLGLHQHRQLIKNIHDYAHQEKTQLTQQALKRIENGDPAADVLEALANQLTNKLTHHPSVLVRRVGEKGHASLLEEIKSVYNLD